MLVLYTHGTEGSNLMAMVHLANVARLEGMESASEGEQNKRKLSLTCYTVCQLPQLPKPKRAANCSSINRNEWGTSRLPGSGLLHGRAITFPSSR